MNVYKFVLLIIIQANNSCASEVRRPGRAVNVNDFSLVPPIIVSLRDRNERNAARDKLRTGDVTIRNAPPLVKMFSRSHARLIRL